MDPTDYTLFSEIFFAVWPIGHRYKVDLGKVRSHTWRGKMILQQTNHTYLEALKKTYKYRPCLSCPGNEWRGICQLENKTAAYLLLCICCAQHRHSIYLLAWILRTATSFLSALTTIVLHSQHIIYSEIINTVGFASKNIFRGLRERTKNWLLVWDLEQNTMNPGNGPRSMKFNVKKPQVHSSRYRLWNISVTNAILTLILIAQF